MESDLIQGLPNWFTKDLEAEVFYSFSKVGKKKLPKDPYNIFFNEYWLNKLGWKTWGNVVDTLNEWGHSPELKAHFSHFDVRHLIGVHDSGGEKTWVLQHTDLYDQPVLRFVDTSSESSSVTNFLLAEQVQEVPRERKYYDFGRYYDRRDNFTGFRIYYTSDNTSFWYKLNNYNWKPDYSELVFLSLPGEHSKLHFGLELEISTKLSPLELQTIVEHVEPKQEKFFYCKHDGSVEGRYNRSGRGGTEIVTMPMTPGRQRREWRTFLKKLETLASAKGASVADFIDTSVVPANGLHIHVSRDSFTRKGGYDHLWQNKFASVWNYASKENLSFLQALSRRVRDIKSAQYFRPHPNMQGRTPAWKMRNGAVCTRHEDRYSCARETDFSVEVRVFQSIWDIDHILYCIDLTAAVHQYCSEIDIQSASFRFASTFKQWLSKQNDFRYAKKGLAKCV